MQANSASNPRIDTLPISRGAGIAIFATALMLLVAITSPPAPTTVWTRVTIETDFARVLVRYDGLVVEDRRLVGAKQSGDISVKIGASGYVISPFDYRIDNLECTVTP